MAKRENPGLKRKQQEECVTIEAVCGADDAEGRWLQALDVLAEYGVPAENTERRDT